MEPRQSSIGNKKAFNENECKELVHVRTLWSQTRSAVGFINRSSDTFEAHLHFKIKLFNHVDIAMPLKLPCTNYSIAKTPLWAT